MSDDKNLGNDLDDMLDDAKKGANDFSEGAKRTANEFSEGARRGANAFENDVDKVMSDGKNIALIAHITLIGWIIALVMNNEKKNRFASFYIRQMLGLMICAFILSFIPMIGWFLNIGLLILWILSLVSALNGEEKLTPVVGAYFQDWFKSL
jgi:uncharacterized membrane protein